MHLEWSRTLKQGAGIAACAVVLTAGTQAADVEVVKAGAIKTTLSLDGVSADSHTASRECRGVLAEDLARSGWFELASGGAGIDVTGTCAVAGAKLTMQCRAVNRVTGRTALSLSLDGPRDRPRRLAHRMTDAIVKAVRDVPGIASTQIVMVGSRMGRQDLYLCDADGARLRRVTREGAVCLSPSWGRDTTEILYTSFHNGYPDAYRIDLAAGRRTRLAAYPGLNSGAVLSPEGTRIAVTLSKDGNPDLYVKTLRSGALLRMTRTSYAAEASPSWSPDGRQIVFVSDRAGRPQLYVVEARGGGRPRRLTYEGRESVAPDWGPDGRIAYSSRRGRFYEVCIYDPRTCRHTQLSDGGGDWEDPSWARDGRHIVCTRTAGYRSHLYILDVLGDPPLRLTSSQGDWYSPDWSAQ